MFDLVSDYAPAGDQPQAIAKLTEGILSGAKHQVLQGVTGSGKTFTVANVIRACGSAPVSGTCDIPTSGSEQLPSRPGFVTRCVP